MRAHFYVYCPSPCKTLKPGKLRVRCALCGDGAFTVDKDPQSWEDVLVKKRITGTCENYSKQVCFHSQIFKLNVSLYQV